MGRLRDRHWHVRIVSDSYANIEGCAKSASISIRSATFVVEVNMCPLKSSVSIQLLAIFIVLAIIHSDCAPQYGYAYYPVDYYILIPITEPPVLNTTSQEVPTFRILCNVLCKP